MDPQDRLFQLFKSIGTPTTSSLERLRQFELNCEERKDPNSFYLTFMMGNPPTISWSYNSKLFLGVEKLDYEGYRDRIHPTWLPLHFAFGAAGYKNGNNVYSDRMDCNAIYTVNIPILHQDGSYCWYNQVSIPTVFDANGELIAHLNQYHRLCPFDRLVPTKPKLNLRGELRNEFDELFAKAGNAAIPDCLNPLLSAANQRIIHTYRKLARKADNGSWLPPAKKEVREELSISAAAINKANVRIIQALDNNFPKCVTRDVAGFATFLNELCGPPGDL